MSGAIQLATQSPPVPGDALFALVIDFQKGTPNAQRVFQAAQAMITAFQDLDRTLCASVDSHIQPVMLLEDIEAGSIKAWLGVQLTRAEDEGLRTLDWKPLIGKYLVRAKYAVIRWSNDPTEGANLVGLARELRKIAAETDVRRIPDYAAPSARALASGIQEIDNAKAFLLPSDRMHWSPVTKVASTLICTFVGMSRSSPTWL